MIGRSGRNGQQGSATIFSPELQGVGIAPFRDLYKNLDRLQRRFSEHIRDNWGWLYEVKGGGLGSLKYPFNTEVEDIFELSSRMIAGTSFGEEDDKEFRNQLYDMVITSWGVFFDKIESDPDRYDRWDECDSKCSGRGSEHSVRRRKANERASEHQLGRRSVQGDHNSWRSSNVVNTGSKCGSISGRDGSNECDSKCSGRDTREIKPRRRHQLGGSVNESNRRRLKRRPASNPRSKYSSVNGRAIRE